MREPHPLHIPLTMIAGALVTMLGLEGWYLAAAVCAVVGCAWFIVAGGMNEE